MGDANPAVEFIGVDLSATLPEYTPPNVMFYVDDVEDEWHWTHKFDIVHARGITGSVRCWPRLLHQVYHNLRPGGWIVVEDFDIDFFSRDGSIEDAHAIREWCTHLQEGAEKTGCSLQYGKQLEKRICDAGFVNATANRATLPIGDWPQNPSLKSIGDCFRTQLEMGLQGMSLRLFNELGWSRASLELLLCRVRRELHDPNKHAEYNV